MLGPAHRCEKRAHTLIDVRIDLPRIRSRQPRRRRRLEVPLHLVAAQDEIERENVQAAHTCAETSPSCQPGVHTLVVHFWAQPSTRTVLVSETIQCITQEVPT